MNKNSRTLFYFILFGMELGLVAVAAVVLAVKGQPPDSIFTTPYPVTTQVAAGITSGLLAGLITTILVLRLPVFSTIRRIAKELITTFRLNIYDLILISVTAGVCEEILFRGVLQPMWGIYITSFIFVLLHGYFSPSNWKLTLFGALIFIISIAIGVMYEIIGLYSSIAFHFSFDLVVLLLIYRMRPVK
mgnify:CR=1 FL=1